MSSVDEEEVLSSIKRCRNALKRLENYQRPEWPTNEVGMWADFVEKMEESVRYFDAFNKVSRFDMQNLRRVKESLEEADEKLKAWAGGSAVLYNVERGDLVNTLVWCKGVVAWLLEHLGEMSAGGGARRDVYDRMEDDWGVAERLAQEGRKEAATAGKQAVMEMRGLLARWAKVCEAA